MSEAVGRTVRQAVDDAEARRLRRASRERWIWLVGGAVVVFVLDQITKLVVRSRIAPGERYDLIPGLELVRARNEGIAFGFFPGNRNVVAALTVIAMVVIAIALIRYGRTNLAVAVGGGLLIGGSLGNLVDRIAHGGVTDFIDPVAWPAFNVADIGIVLGAAIVALGLLRAGALR